MSAPDADRAELALALRNEALELVAHSGLGDVLTAQLGSYEVVGSVALNLMSWRDIDIYVEIARDEPQRFIDTLPPLYAAFARAGHTIFRMSFHDVWYRPRGDYGQGLYFGLRVATPAGTVWKVDLWGWDGATYARKIQEHAQLAQALVRANRPPDPEAEARSTGSAGISGHHHESRHLPVRPGRRRRHAGPAEIILRSEAGRHPSSIASGSASCPKTHSCQSAGLSMVEALSRR